MIDTDGDGILDVIDSCPTRFDSGSDTDSDAIDDVCDTDWVFRSDLHIQTDDFQVLRATNARNETMHYTLGEPEGRARIHITSNGSLVLGADAVLTLAGQSSINLSKTDYFETPHLWLQDGAKIRGEGGKNRLGKIISLGGRLLFEEQTEIDGIGSIWIASKTLNHPTTSEPETFEGDWWMLDSSGGFASAPEPDHLVIKNSPGTSALSVSNSDIDLSATTFENNDGYPLFCGGPAQGKVFPETCRTALVSSHFIGNRVNSIRAGCSNMYTDPSRLHHESVVGPSADQVNPPEELHLSHCLLNNANNLGNYFVFQDITLASAHSFTFDADGMITGSSRSIGMYEGTSLVIDQFQYTYPTRVSFENVDAMNLLMSVGSGTLMVADGSRIGTFGMTYRDYEAPPTVLIRDSTWDLSGSRWEVQLSFWPPDSPVEYYGATVTSYDWPSHNLLEISNSEVIVDEHYDGLVLKDSGYLEPVEFEAAAGVTTDRPGFRYWSGFFTFDEQSVVTGASASFRLATVRRALGNGPDFVLEAGEGESP